MIIEIERIPEEGLKVSRDFEFACDELVEENTVFLEPVHVEGTIKRVGEEVLIKGQLTTRLNFVCCRCLTPFEFPVDSRKTLGFLKHYNINRRGRIEALASVLAGTMSLFDVRPLNGWPVFS